MKKEGERRGGLRNRNSILMKLTDARDPGQYIRRASNEIYRSQLQKKFSEMGVSRNTLLGSLFNKTKWLFIVILIANLIIRTVACEPHPM